MKKIVIVGGVAGGASAAARIRRLDETAEIIMFEKDEYISFANCGLPYHVGEVIEERRALIVQTPKAMKMRFNIDVRTFSEVVSVNTKAKTVHVKSSEKEYDESYDILVLAPGANPADAPFENNAESRTFRVRTIPDIDRIKAFIVDEEVKTAAVIGGGFIGVEMAENMRELGLEVTLIEAAQHILPPFDAEIAVLAEDKMRSHGVNVLTGEFVESINEEDSAAVIKTKSGKEIKAEIIISAIGVKPATDFLKDSGIALTPRGHIITDNRMLTNAADVYAAGDAVAVKDFVTEAETAVPLAGPANKQGRIIGDQVNGIDHRYKGTQGSAVIKVFELTVAGTGANERTLEKLGIEYKAIYSHPFSHATYYPGATPLSCKMMFSPEGKILGCQIAGENGAEKRLDVVATAMRLGADVRDLTELELSYAPPYSSAKDPVNMLGYIAQNVLEGKSNLVDYKYMLARDKENTVLLDVRTPAEYERGHMEGAVNIPVDELRSRLGELDKSKEIIEYCQVGLRAHVAERILANNGFNVKNVSGGWKTISSMI